MNLAQTSATIILSLFLAYIILFNILEIPYKDIIKTPGLSQAEAINEKQLTKEELAKIEKDNESLANASLSDIEMNLRKEFGVANEKPNGVSDGNLTCPPRNDRKFITNKLPETVPGEVMGAVYNPEYQVGCQAANQDLYEKEALFGSEQTNVAQFFANNPGLFFNDQRHNTYVPNVTDWNNQGQKLFTNRVNDHGGKIHAFNYKDQCGSAQLV